MPADQRNAVGAAAVVPTRVMLVSPLAPGMVSERVGAQVGAVGVAAVVAATGAAFGSVVTGLGSRGGLHGRQRHILSQGRPSFICLPIPVYEQTTFSRQGIGYGDGR